MFNNWWQNGRILEDNGGEIANKEFKTLCENLNIWKSTTAAQSPCNNSLIEPHNAFLGLITTEVKIIEGTCDLNMAVAWVISATSSLKNVNGYSVKQ